MKKIIILLSLLLCGFAFAATETLNWYVDGQIYATTTCQTGGDIILPTAPTKYGYTFQGWKSYTPIEYLESTGTQWIDTRVSPNINTSVDYKLRFTRLSSGSQPLIGARVFSGDQGRFFPLSFTGTNNSLARTVLGTSEVTFSVNTSTDYVGSFKPAYGVSIINDQIYQFTGFEFKKLINNNLYLFATSGYGASLYNSFGKIYYVKIYDNDILVHDFIPVLDYNGIPCMYDKVTDQFFYNSGTGDFIAGPVINQ